MLLGNALVHVLCTPLSAVQTCSATPPCFFNVTRLPDTPASLLNQIRCPPGHLPQQNDVVCVLKRAISDSEPSQHPVTIMGGNLHTRLRSPIPQTFDPRVPTGKKGDAWHSLADKFIEQEHHNPNAARGAAYLRALADNKCAEGKTPTPLPWHCERGLVAFLSGGVSPEFQRQVLPVMPFRATWS